MLKLANVTKNDVVYDLGCGDGKIVIAAAKKYGARAVGIDIDPERIKEATANAKAAGVSDRVTFIHGDIFDPRPSRFATRRSSRSTCCGALNQQLRPRLWRSSRPARGSCPTASTWVHDWPPQRTQHVSNFTIYLWTIPQACAGLVDGRPRRHRC